MLFRSLCLCILLPFAAGVANDVVVPFEHWQTYIYEIAPSFEMIDSVDSDTIRTTSIDGGGRLQVWSGIAEMPSCPPDCGAWSLTAEVDNPNQDTVLFACIITPLDEREFSIPRHPYGWYQEIMWHSNSGHSFLGDTTLAGYDAWLLNRDYPDSRYMAVVCRAYSHNELVIRQIDLHWTWTPNAVRNEPSRDLPEFQISPNPARDWISVDHADRIQIYDILGRQVSARSQSSIYDVSNLPAGIYFVEMRRGNIREFQKLTIIK